MHVSAGAEERLPRYCDAAGGADRPAGPTHAQYHRLHAPQDPGNSSTTYISWHHPFTSLINIFASVADSGCLSRIRLFSILDPHQRILSILTQKMVSKL